MPEPQDHAGKKSHHDSDCSTPLNDNPKAPDGNSQVSHIPSNSRCERSLYQAIVEEPITIDVSDTSTVPEERTLIRETKQIRIKFAGLVAKVMKSIEENKVTIKRLATFFHQMKATRCTTAENPLMLFTNEAIRDIETNCKDIDDVFRKLPGYYSWFNYDLIEGIIDAFCDKNADLKTRLSNYQINMRKYCKNRLYRFPHSLNGFGEHRDDTESCVFKIDKEWEEMRFSDIDTVTEIICDVLELEKVAVHLRSASNGCVQLTYDIPQHVAGTVFPLTKDRKRALEKHGIRFNGK